MNNLAYSTQDSQKVASKVEELLRKEIGASGPVTYEVEEAGAEHAGAASMLKDAQTYLFGGSPTRLLTVHFHLTQPRAADLDVHMNRQGAGCYAGSLVYCTSISKSVAGEVSFGDDGKFSGDADAAGKLNSSKEVLKKCNAFAVKEGGITGFEVKIPRVFKIAPGGNGAQIVGATTARSKSMGFSATFSSREFFELVGLIEGAL